MTDPQTAVPPTPSPTLHLRPSNLVELLGSMQQFAEPACKFLDRTLRDYAAKAAADAPEAAAVRAAAQEVPHFETLLGWVAQNQQQAACIVLAAVYLSTGRYVVQEVVEPKPVEQAVPAGDHVPAPSPQLVT